MLKSSRFVLTVVSLPPNKESMMSDMHVNKIRFDRPGCDWQITLVNPHQEGDELVAENFVLARANGKHFHQTLVTDDAMNASGELFTFSQPMIFKHDLEKGKVGDIVLIFRKHPHTDRWMVQVDQENAFITDTNVRKVWRAVRSSLDNVLQAIKNRPVIQVGMGYSNTRRIGGNMIAQHYVRAGWSPQMENSMMDVFDYADSPDSMGQAVFLKALKHMPERMANEVFQQIRQPIEINNK
jgi:hypothetical protein